MGGMKKSLVVAAVAGGAALAAPGAARAGPCGTTVLSNWLVPGFSCTVGDKAFSNFSYTPDGLNVPATAVGVGPAVTPDPGIQFNGGFSNRTDVVLDAAFSFTVTAGAGFLIKDAELQILSGTGDFSDTESFFAFPGGPAVGTPLVATNEDPLSEILATPLKSIFVTDDLTVFPGGSVSIIDKQFSQITTPEPASLAMLGISLLGMGAYRRLRK